MARTPPSTSRSPSAPRAISAASDARSRSASTLSSRELPAGAQQREREGRRAAAGDHQAHALREPEHEGGQLLAEVGRRHRVVVVEHDHQAAIEPGEPVEEGGRDLGGGRVDRARVVR